MTKRFVLDDGLILDNGKEMEDVVDVLNKFNDTVNEYYDYIKRLEQENEQLKEEIKDLNDILARYEEKELKE